MNKVSYLVTEPTEAEVDAGVLMVHRLRKDGDSVEVMATRTGVTIAGRIAIQNREELDTVAKGIAMAWKDYERKRVNLGGIM